MSVTIRDIAKKSGVPLEEVNRIFREYESEEGEVRRRVMSAAREMGYPLENKTTGRTMNLGVLFWEESKSGLLHPFFASMLNAFKTEAESRGYDITFINHHVGAEQATYLRHCRYRRVDGVFLACGDFYSDEVQELLSSDIPCVIMDYIAPNQLSVLSDNRRGMRMLVDYAVSQGHRRIAFISGQRNSEVTEDRIDEFKAAMRDHHLPLPDEYLVEGRYDEIDVIRPLVEQMISLPERPTCILLPDDSSYLGAQEVIRAQELRIPADISVAGYDGIRLTQSLRPHLTTIRQDSEAMGAEAARRLIDRIENGTPPGDPLVMPVTLIQGETIGWCSSW